MKHLASNHASQLGLPIRALPLMKELNCKMNANTFNSVWSCPTRLKIGWTQNWGKPWGETTHVFSEERWPKLQCTLNKIRSIILLQYSWTYFLGKTITTTPPWFDINFATWTLEVAFYDIAIDEWGYCKRKLYIHHIQNSPCRCLWRVTQSLGRQLHIIEWDHSRVYFSPRLRGDRWGICP